MFSRRQILRWKVLRDIKYNWIAMWWIITITVKSWLYIANKKRMKDENGWLGELFNILQHKENWVRNKLIETTLSQLIGQKKIHCKIVSSLHGTIEKKVASNKNDEGRKASSAQCPCGIVLFLSLAAKTAWLLGNVCEEQLSSDILMSIYCVLPHLWTVKKFYFTMSYSLFFSSTLCLLVISFWILSRSVKSVPPGIW